MANENKKSLIKSNEEIVNSLELLNIKVQKIQDEIQDISDFQTANDSKIDKTINRIFNLEKNNHVLFSKINDLNSLCEEIFSYTFIIDKLKTTLDDITEILEEYKEEKAESYLMEKELDELTFTDRILTSKGNCITIYSNIPENMLKVVFANKDTFDQYAEYFEDNGWDVEKTELECTNSFIVYNLQSALDIIKSFDDSISNNIELSDGIIYEDIEEYISLEFNSDDCMLYINYQWEFLLSKYKENLEAEGWWRNSYENRWETEFTPYKCNFAKQMIDNFMETRPEITEGYEGYITDDGIIDLSTYEGTGLMSLYFKYSSLDDKYRYELEINQWEYDGEDDDWVTFFSIEQYNFALNIIKAYEERVV